MYQVQRTQPLQRLERLHNDRTPVDEAPGGWPSSSTPPNALAVAVMSPEGQTLAWRNADA